MKRNPFNPYSHTGKSLFFLVLMSGLWACSDLLFSTPSKDESLKLNHTVSERGVGLVSYVDSFPLSHRYYKYDSLKGKVIIDTKIIEQNQGLYLFRNEHSPYGTQNLYLKFLLKDKQGIYPNYGRRMLWQGEDTIWDTNIQKGKRYFYHLCRYFYRTENGYKVDSRTVYDTINKRWNYKFYQDTIWITKNDTLSNGTITPQKSISEIKFRKDSTLVVETRARDVDSVIIVNDTTQELKDCSRFYEVHT